MTTGRDILTGWMGRHAENGVCGGVRRGAEPTQGLRFAFYGRTSTTEHQDPHTSRAWQLEVSFELIAGHGHIVAASSTPASPAVTPGATGSRPRSPGGVARSEPRV